VTHTGYLSDLLLLLLLLRHEAVLMLQAQYCRCT